MLFIRSRNRLRSLTAETVFVGLGGHQVRSAGYVDADMIDQLRGGVAPYVEFGGATE